MKIICEHCGKESTKYTGLKLDPEWLQAYLDDYFDRNTKIFDFTDHHDRKEVQFRRLIFFVFREFTTLKQGEIARRFHTTDAMVCNSIRDCSPMDHDLKFILKDLRGELPVNGESFDCANHVNNGNGRDVNK